MGKSLGASFFYGPLCITVFVEFAGRDHHWCTTLAQMTVVPLTDAIVVDGNGHSWPK